MTDKKVVIKAKAKTKSNRKAERPEIRIFNSGKFNNDTNGDKEVFRNLKSSSICSLKMERTSETSCKVFVGFVGYTTVEGDKKDDTLYVVHAVPLAEWRKLRSSILKGNSVGRAYGKFNSPIESINDNHEIEKNPRYETERLK